MGLGGAGGYRLRQGRLIATSPDDVTVVAEWQDENGPGNPPPSELRHATFQPWGSWPGSDVGPNYLLSFDGGRFAAVSSVGDGTFSAFFADDVALRYMPAIKTYSGAVPNTVNVEAVPMRAVFAASASATDLLGWERVVGPGETREIVIGTASRGDGVFLGDDVVGCTNDVGGAGAVPYGDGFLMAHGLGHWGACAGAAEDPTTLAIGFVSGALGLPVYQPLFSFDNVLPVRRVRVAPDADGIWIVWRTETSGVLPPVHFARFDFATNDLLGPILATDPNDGALGPIAASRMGDRLVLGWIDDPQLPDPTFHLATFSVDGALQARTSFPIGGQATGPIYLLGSPDGQSVLASWSVGGGANPDRVRLQRLDCAN